MNYWNWLLHRTYSIIKTGILTSISIMYRVVKSNVAKAFYVLFAMSMLVVSSVSTLYDVFTNAVTLPGILANIIIATVGTLILTYNYYVLNVKGKDYKIECDVSCQN